jgi:hypothetical protein
MGWIPGKSCWIGKKGVLESIPAFRVLSPSYHDKGRKWVSRRFPKICGWHFVVGRGDEG